MLASLNARAAIVSLLIFVLLAGLWEILNQPPNSSEALTEYELLMGGVDHVALFPIASSLSVFAFIAM